MNRNTLINIAMMILIQDTKDNPNKKPEDFIKSSVDTAINLIGALEAEIDNTEDKE